MKNYYYLLLIFLTILLWISACVLTTNPIPTVNSTLTLAGSSAYGFATDYTWLKGQVLITAIQANCTYLVYDPSGSDQYGGKVILSGNLKGLVNQQWIIVYGVFDISGVRQVCAGATFTYYVSRYDLYTP